MFMFLLRPTDPPLSAFRMHIRGLAVTLLAVAGVSLGASQTWSSPGWELLKVPGKTAAQFALSKSGTIRVTAKSAVGFLYRPLQGSEAKGKQVDWRWRVDRSFPPTDLAVKGQDDRPLALHFWFDYPANSSSLFGGIGSLLGFPRVGYVLTYVWGGKQSRGTVMKNPHYGKGAIIVLRSGKAALGKWRREKRNIAGDFKRSFGHLPKPGTLKYVAVSGDTDDSRSESAASISNLRFTGGN